MGSIFIWLFEKKVAWKLRTIILLHFRLVAFWLHFGEPREVIVFIIFRFVDMSMTPKTYYVQLWRSVIFRKWNREVTNPKMKQNNDAVLSGHSFLLFSCNRNGPPDSPRLRIRTLPWFPKIYKGILLFFRAFRKTTNLEDPGSLTRA